MPEYRPTPAECWLLTEWDWSENEASRSERRGRYEMLSLLAASVRRR